MISVCQVTLQDHVIKALYDFVIRSLSRYIIILVSLVVKDSGNGYKMVLVCHVILQDHVIKG